MKRKIVELMLEEMLTAPRGQGAVQIFFAAEAPGADVPAGIGEVVPGPGCKMARLNFSHRYMPRSLTVDDFGLTQVLSFRGKLYECKVPWNAIASADAGDTTVNWPFAIPEAKEEPAAKVEEIRPRPSHLRSVD